MTILVTAVLGEEIINKAVKWWTCKLAPIVSVDLEWVQELMWDGFPYRLCVFCRSIRWMQILLRRGGVKIERWVMTGTRRALFAVVLTFLMEKKLLLRAVKSRWNLDTMAREGSLQKHVLVLREREGVWVKPSFLPLGKCLGFYVLMLPYSIYKPALSLHVQPSCPDLVCLLTQRKCMWVFGVLSAVDCSADLVHIAILWMEMLPLFSDRLT